MRGRRWERAEGMTYTTLVEPKRVPVIMCVWKRIDRLPHTLEMLAEQDTPAALYIWNNNPREVDRLDALVAGSPIPAQLVHCNRNIGCFGRFYIARELAEVHDALLFIDDDQDFGRRMVSDQMASFEPESIAGWWAFRYLPGARSYAERKRVDRPMEPADYVGVGGLVADARIFRDSALFRCPRRYWFVDDIWLSYYTSHVHGWRLRRSFAEFQFDSDGKDVHETLWPTKARMFRYLKRRGWDVARP
jgi:hypothetical protein